MRLNAAARTPISSSLRSIGTRAEKSPSSTRPAAATSPAKRPHQPIGEAESDEDRQTDDEKRAEQQRRVEAKLEGSSPFQRAIVSRCWRSAHR